MKRIIFKSVYYADFKGAKPSEYHFKSSRNKVYGANGTGKTTLAEAITFALFGFGMFGERVLSEPIMPSGKIKENYQQRFKLELTVDDKLYTITRTIENNYIKSAFINNKPFKLKRDFNMEIESILGISRDQFLLLTNPKYFNSLEPKVARKFIISLIDQFNDADLIAMVENKDNADFLITVKQNLKEGIDLKTQLEMKAQELKTAMQNVKDKEVTLTTKKDTLNKISSESEMENIDLVKLQAKQKSLKEQIDSVSEKRTEQLKMQTSGDKLKNKIRISKDIIEENARRINVDKNSIIENNKKIETYKKKFDEINLSKVQDSCALCGAITDKTIKLNTEHKERQLNDIEERVKNIKKEISVCNDRISKLSAELDKESKELELNEKRDSLSTFEVVNYDTSELQEELNKVTETIGSFGAVDIVAKDIKNIKEDIKVQKLKLDKLEFENETLKEAFKMKSEKIEKTINSQLDTINVKLFEIKKNGNIKNIFTIEKDGINFNRMNNAKQINSGIELVNFIQKQMKIETIIFIDNAESVNRLQPTANQTLELYVSSGKLEVK